MFFPRCSPLYKTETLKIDFMNSYGRTANALNMKDWSEWRISFLP